MAPNLFSIGVTKNKFSLLDSEDEVDPHELLKEVTLKKEEKKKAKKAEKSNLETSEKNISRSKKTSSDKPSEASGRKETLKPKPSGGPIAKKQVKGFNQHISQKPNFEERSRNVEKDKGVLEPEGFRRDASSGSEDGGLEDGRGERRGFSRVFVRGGGSRGKAQQEDRRKREHDRHSGSDRTGVKPVDKRRARGSYNWGTHQDDLLAEVVPKEEVEEKKGSPVEEPKLSEDKQHDEASEEATKNKIDAEKPSLTLDEWKALKSSHPKPSYNLRKPGEGEDLTRWENMVALEKKSSDEGDGDDEYDLADYPQRVGRQKKLDINVRFSDRRGTGRGRAPRRGSPSRPPSEPPRATAPVYDETHFPSLI